MHKSPIVYAAALSLCLLPSAPLTAQLELPPAAQELGGKIVNGVTTAGFPSVGLFLNDTSSCTATLIGCNTALTAAHCICGDPSTGQLLTGAQCVQRADLLNPLTKLVYFHHAGLFGVASVTVNPAFRFGLTSDLAILKLTGPVTGIAPSSFNTVGKPGNGSPGLLVGFGITETPGSGAGIKRSGALSVAPCTASGVDGTNHVCASFNLPAGLPGTNSSTCHGDSGGPLFVDFGAGPTIAGTTSGGDSPSGNCTAPNHLWFADVFKDRAWIAAVGGSDLGTVACGGLPAAGGPNTSLSGATGTLSPLHLSDTFSIAVPAGLTHFRVGLTAEKFTSNDYNLYLKNGGPATPASFDCKSDGFGTLAFCDVTAPAAGTWNVLVNGVGGPGGGYELVTTMLGQINPLCVPSATTLCLDDHPNDRRFKVEMTFGTAQGGGLAGAGQAVNLAPVGFTSGGAFHFGNPSNPEVLVKVFNQCSFNNSIWVFFSAGTNFGFNLRVTDTATGRSKSYANTDLQQAAPVADTSALSCS